MRFKKVKREFLYMSTFWSKIFHHFFDTAQDIDFFIVCHVSRHVDLDRPATEIKINKKIVVHIFLKRHF
jgi:hypothetical protein